VTLQLHPGASIPCRSPPEPWRKLGPGDSACCCFGASAGHAV